MKITFIRPSMIPGRAHDAMEPLVFAILSGLTPPAVERVLYDDRIEALPLQEPTDLVAMTVDTYSSRRAYQIAAHYRRRGIPVIMGGAHPTLCPEETLRYADAIARGDAEDLWPAIVEDVRNGTLKKTYQSRFPSLSALRLDRSIFGKKRYRVLRVSQFGRGCPHGCDFCSVHAFYGKRIRHYPVEDIVKDLQSDPGRFIFFVDDHLFADRGAGKSLCLALKPLKRRWACQVGLDIARDRALVKSMAEGGCRMALVGFESTDIQNLRQMRKEWHGICGPYEKLVNVFNEFGIMVYGTFVFGYDEDTPETIRSCLHFARRTGLAMANFNLLMPFPGTTLHERLRSQKRLVNDTWWIDERYRFGQALFTPRRMTTEQLEKSCWAARRSFNSAGCVLSRLLRRWVNMSNAGIFLALNGANRLELNRKQGRALGGDNPAPAWDRHENHSH